MIRYTGQRIKRLEDPRLLRGRGRYVGDIAMPGMLTLAFVRSPHAHARVGAIDVSKAQRLPGVVTVLTAEHLAGVAEPLVPHLSGEGFTPTAWPALAGSRVRYTGEAVALVVAESPYIAIDARDQVTVDYEPAPAVVSIDEALSLDRFLFQRSARQGDVAGAFARAAVTLAETFTHARCAAAPIEPRGVVAEWDGERLTVWASTQTPHILRATLARLLAMPLTSVRVIAPDVGGGFGMKMHVFPEDVAIAAAARLVGRPVRWLETRGEQMLAASHARAQRFDAELAADAEGRVLALRARAVSDAGAYHIYPLTQALEPLGSSAILPGPYRTPAYEWEAIAVETNKVPLGAYRGVGMTMGAFVMERMLDGLAARLGLDPADVRRRNLLPRDAYPFTSASGLPYDSGDFPKALEQALGAIEYDALRAEQVAARAEGRAFGIGIACYTEYTGMGAEIFRRRGMDDVPGIEAATVTMEADGSVRCVVSFPAQGQGHGTAVAQLVADRLGVAMERVRLEAVDTMTTPGGSGTFGSRGMVTLHGTIAIAADEVRRKLETLAGHLLEASPDDVVLDAGRAHVRGMPDRGVDIAEIAHAAYSPPRGGLPIGMPPGLEATTCFDPGLATFSNAVHIAAVEVDRDTGRVQLGRYVVVEDCGVVVNPMIVDGQIEGAVAQGIGEALLEAVVHDTDGQLLTGTLMDYALPRAVDVPPIQIGHLETPSARMPGGVKGMGEGGTIGAPAAVANAVADAMRPHGVTITSLPISPAALVKRTG